MAREERTYFYSTLADTSKGYFGRSVLRSLDQDPETRAFFYFLLGINILGQLFSLTGVYSNLVPNG